MKPVGKLILVLIAIAAAMFAVANRSPIMVSLWPLPFDVTLPLYLAVLGALAAGLVVGAVLSWPGRQRLRWRARASDKRAARLAGGARPAVDISSPDSAAQAAVGASPALPRPRRSGDGDEARAG